MNNEYSYTQLNNRLSNRSSIKIENNTYAYKIPNTTQINIDLHGNTIAQLTDSTIILSSSGWMTNTTKDRLNKILPDYLRIYQKSGQWFIYNYAYNQAWGIFADGITFTKNQDSQWHVDKSTMGQDNTSLRKSIIKYVKGYITALKGGEIELPSNGDCMACRGILRIDDTEHLKLHIEEDYYVPSLLFNAIQSYPVSQMGAYAIQCLMTGESLHDNLVWIVDQQVYNSLKKYLFHSFGIPT